MSQLPTDPPQETRRTVLDSIARKTGEPPKVLLPDADSEHGVSPMVDPGSDAAKLVPQGRGNYQILGEIARGGMGRILKGHDTDLGRDVAVKVLDEKLAEHPSVVQRFVEEAQIGGQLQHPGIVPVYELGLMADDTPYFTMKLVKGRTLSAILSKRKSPTHERGRLLSIFASVCQTMAYAHSKGVIHRDLKPANIMVGAFGEVQVVDWGLAKVLNRGGVADEVRARETLHTVIETVRSGPGSGGTDSLVGSVMGTPAYMAPEQAQGEIDKLDERADVFSLGGILCEILTGKPPYEHVEGEKTTVRAARGKLDPARERIEGCKADEALKELCLACLMPARDARPDSADELARAIEEHLSSVEDRAHAAELAATEARVKAEQERRARVLTLSLAATILIALVAGGGGWYTVREQREARAAEVRAAVEQAQGESIELGQAGRPEEALAAAHRALSLTETGEADATLRARAERFVAQAEAAVDAAERERELTRQDESLYARLEELRLEQIATLNDPIGERGLDEAFSEAFREYGVDLEGDDLVPALERIRERHIAEEVALALDDWGRIRRKRYGRDSREAENLFILAMDLDPDPQRMRVREAIQALDREAMLELAAPENLSKLPPGSIWVLSSALWRAFPQDRGDVYRMYDHALHLYPDDFILQSIGANIYRNAGRFRDALRCAGIARALRPGMGEAVFGMAEALFFAGRMTEALGAYRAALVVDPENAAAHYGEGMTHFQLGDYAASVESLERSLALSAIGNSDSDLLCARFFVGRADQDEVVAAMESTTNPLTIATYAWALVDHPDPRQRDPERALEALRLVSDLDAEVYIDAVARIRMEDWAGALESIGGEYLPRNFLVITPAALDFVRALIYAKLGEEAVARECHARAMATLEELTGGQPEAWARSDVMRWRREAEAALGI